MGVRLCNLTASPRFVRQRYRTTHATCAASTRHIARRPIFPGASDIDQLFCVISLLGKPTSNRWRFRTPPLRFPLTITRRAVVGLASSCCPISTRFQSPSALPFRSGVSCQTHRARSCGYSVACSAMSLPGKSLMRDSRCNQVVVQGEIWDWGRVCQVGRGIDRGMRH